MGFFQVSACPALIRPKRVVQYDFFCCAYSMLVVMVQLAYIYSKLQYQSKVLKHYYF